MQTIRIFLRPRARGWGVVGVMVAMDASKVGLGAVADGICWLGSTHSRMEDQCLIRWGGGGVGGCGLRIIRCSEVNMHPCASDVLPSRAMIL